MLAEGPEEKVCMQGVIVVQRFGHVQTFMNMHRGRKGRREIGDKHTRIRTSAAEGSFLGDRRARNVWKQTQTHLDLIQLSNSGAQTAGSLQE